MGGRMSCLLFKFLIHIPDLPFSVQPGPEKNTFLLPASLAGSYTLMQDAIQRMQKKEKNAKCEEETKMTENMKELSVNEMEQVNGGYDTYIVVKGDTLYKISRRYGVTVDDLVRWNGIKNRNLIHPGQQLKIY